VAESGFMSTVNAIIADKTPLESRDAAFSLSFIFGTMSFGFGSSIPFLFPYLESSLSISSLALHTNILIVFGLINLIAPLAFWLILRDYKEERRSSKINWRGKSLRTLYKFSGINSIIGLGAGLIIPLIPLWLLLKFGIQDTYSGPLLAIASITMALAGFLSPRIARRYGSVRAIALAESLSTIFMISLAFIGNPVLAASIYILRAAMMNMASPLADSYLMRIVSPEERGLASSINSVIWRLPNSVTTYIGGILLASGNYSLPFLLGAALYIVSITLFYSVFRNFKPASNESNGSHPT
jgi:MFS family permease